MMLKHFVMYRKKKKKHITTSGLFSHREIVYLVNKQLPLPQTCPRTSYTFYHRISETAKKILEKIFLTRYNVAAFRDIYFFFADWGFGGDVEVGLKEEW